MKTIIKATKFATVAEIEEALKRWPRHIPDRVHIESIRRETGLGPRGAMECLLLARGWEGDCPEVAD